MSFQVNKPKSAGKEMIGPSERLNHKLISTLATIADMVGATLGPGGRQVLIERPEIGMKPIITKDGVTVMKHLGFADATQQLILEAARDAAIRTASEAGDGTTTASILSWSIAKATQDIVKEHSKVSPQRIIREMTLIESEIEELIKSYSMIAEDRDALLRVAELSANGDTELANAILDALDTVGDEGNITIIENTGATGYEIQKINGYTVEQGHEVSCRNLANGFINDKTGTKTVLESPIVILFDGVLNDFFQIFNGLNNLDQYLSQKGIGQCNILFVAHGFSDAALGDFYTNWNHASTKMKIMPLLTQDSMIRSSRTQQLYDLQAYVGTPVFNPIDKSIADADWAVIVPKNRTTFVEVDRFKTSIIAVEDLEAIKIRVEELQARLKSPESEYEIHELRTRIGKLNAGIARLQISAPTVGETREKRDRAEDAWMAIKGAIKYGACPGGGYVLVRLHRELLGRSERLDITETRKLAYLVLGSALIEPVWKLYQNYGYLESEIVDQIVELLQREDEAFDIPSQKWVPKFDLLDSAPAVIEAIRNSISIASLLGSLGGIVAFQRDAQSDKEEEKFVRKFEADSGMR
jgi:chaperonin GroEL